MEPIVLQGNLGERHRSLNSAAHQVIHNNIHFNQIKDLKEESDIDRLYKIDCANKYRDLDYILETLKCEDTLYATRALKCTWLFTEKQYEYIVNPQYLYETLFPDMMNVIIHKFIAKILKHMRDYEQCEKFYKYYKETKSDRADKFLTLCGPQIIHNEIANPNNFIVSAEILQYFCKKSPEAIQAFFTRFTNTDWTWDYIYSVRSLYFSNKDIFLDLLEKYFNRSSYCEPKLGYRISKDILKNNKIRVLNNLKIYEKILNSTIFLKSLTESEVKQILSIIAPQKLSDFWSASSQLKEYIQLLKPNDRYPTFLCLFKSIFVSIELETSKEFYTHEWYKYMSIEQQHDWALNHVQLNSEFCGLEVYSWYRFCKFNVAFAELNKIIKTEKAPEERICMLKVVVDALGDSTEDAHTLLSHFKERHVNEMPHMKERFLRKLLGWNHIYKIEEKTWLILQEIFISLGFSEDNPHTRSSLYCEATHFNFAYCVINDKSIPDKLESQFMENFSYLRDLRNKVDKDDEDKLFKALYQLLEEKIGKFKPPEKEYDWMNLKNTVNQFISLFDTWGKSTTDYPLVIRHIRSITLDWRNMYYVSRYKELFSREELLAMYPTESAFLIFLKSNVTIFQRYVPKLNECVDTNKFCHKTLLKKIRIYFYNDFADVLQSFFINKLQHSTSDDKNISLQNTITALCLLLPAHQFQETIIKYIPKETKVNMLKIDMHFFSLQKHFAKCLYLTRPLTSELILPFAKGDYLQFALNSLVSICVQMSLNKFTTFVRTLLNNPVSVQKHAIRLARRRLPKTELVTLMEKLWESKNISIKEVVFESCFEILCEQSIPDDINNWWHLVRKFIQEMEGIEYRSMYTFVKKISRTPSCIHPEICMESWYCMKRAPDNNLISNYKRSILDDLKNIFKAINEEFLYEVINELLKDAFPDNVSETERLYHGNIWIEFVSKYLIYCNNLNKQNERVEKVLTAILNRTKALWNETKANVYLVREMFKVFIYSLVECAINEVCRRDNNYISSMALFEFIMSTMAEHLTIKSGTYYVLKFGILYLECLSDVSEDTKEMLVKEVKNNCKYERFGRKLAAMQNSLVQTYSPLVHVFFTKFLINYLGKCIYEYNNEKYIIPLIEALIVEPSEIHNVLTAIELLPAIDDKDEFKGVIEKIYSFNHIEVHLMLNMKYGENRRHKFF